MAKKPSNPNPDNAEGKAGAPAEVQPREVAPGETLESAPAPEGLAERAIPAPEVLTQAATPDAAAAQTVLPQFKMQVLHRMEHVAPGGNVRFNVYLETRQNSPLVKPIVNEMRLNGLSAEQAQAFEVGREYTLTFTAETAE